MFPVNFRLPWVQGKCSWFAVDQDSLERIQSFGRCFLSNCFVPGPGLGTGGGRKVKVPIKEWTPGVVLRARGIQGAGRSRLHVESPLAVCGGGEIRAEP